MWDWKSEKSILTGRRLCTEFSSAFKTGVMFWTLLLFYSIKWHKKAPLAFVQNHFLSIYTFCIILNLGEIFMKIVSMDSLFHYYKICIGKCHMVGTKLALKEPFSCLRSKYDIRVIQFNYLSFSFFRLKQSKRCGYNVKNMKILHICGIKFSVIITLILICWRLLRRILNKKT